MAWTFIMAKNQSNAPISRCYPRASLPKNPDSSFRLDIGCLDDRPPSFRFGLLERAQGFGRLLRERRDLDTEFIESLAHHWIRKNLHHRRVQLGDDILRRILRHPESIPERGKEAAKARLVRRRNIR